MSEEAKMWIGLIVFMGLPIAIIALAWMTDRMDRWFSTDRPSTDLRPIDLRPIDRPISTERPVTYGRPTGRQA
jgi:hypothetical protein